MKYSGISILIVFFIFLSACSIKSKPITEGVDTCENCKMTVMEKKYAGEIVTNRGRTFIFDDLHCLNNYLSVNMLAKDEVKFILVSDYYNPDKLIPADKALFFYSEELHTPMNGKTVALSDSGGLTKIQGEYNGMSRLLVEVIQ